MHAYQGVVCFLFAFLGNNRAGLIKIRSIIDFGKGASIDTWFQSLVLFLFQLPSHRYLFRRFPSFAVSLLHAMSWSSMYEAT
ncbi:hypothetical protein QBC36DRAFT_326682 [Triangularia setosa]|uniref:Uncharacterized protein n=1 Tax=Triangularia setosa TaxID=2587417 RepID=A0AAN7A924_9PEZI|nr:hypothetical protein QBC36DRAFT_326682 [Podospora setosa]